MLKILSSAFHASLSDSDSEEAFRALWVGSTLSKTALTVKRAFSINTCFRLARTAPMIVFVFVHVSDLLLGYSLCERA